MRSCHDESAPGSSSRAGASGSSGSASPKSTDSSCSSMPMKSRMNFSVSRDHTPSGSRTAARASSCPSHSPPSGTAAAARQPPRARPGSGATTTTPRPCSLRLRVSRWILLQHQPALLQPPRLDPLVVFPVVHLLLLQLQLGQVEALPPPLSGGAVEERSSAYMCSCISDASAAASSRKDPSPSWGRQHRGRLVVVVQGHGAELG